MQDRLVLRVAFVTSIHPDFDARVWKYAVMLARRGHRVHLVCPWRAEDGQVREGVTLHTFPKPQSALARVFSVPPRVLKKLTPLLGSVDAVHFHDIDLLPYMAVLGLFKPVVYDVHENYPEEMLVRKWVPNPLRPFLYHGVRVLQALLSLFVRNVVFVVDDQRKDFPLRFLRMAMIRNYATLDLLQCVSAEYSERTDTVVFTGSNHETNGTFLLLEIAERFLTRRPDLRFLMVDRWANAATKERALSIIRDRRLRNVSIVPNVLPQEVMRHLNRGTIGILPALRCPQYIRALPTKLFEYMAAALPVVASDLPNSVRVAEASGGLVLCRPEDPGTFVTAIERLMDDREYAARLGKCGQRAFTEMFCWEGQAGALEDFYCRILGRASSGQVLGRVHVVAR